MLWNALKTLLEWITLFSPHPLFFSHQLYGLSLSRIFYDMLSRSQFYYSGTFLLWCAWRKAANRMWKDKFTLDCLIWRYSLEFKSQVVQSKINCILCLYIQRKQQQQQQKCNYFGCPKTTPRLNMFLSKLCTDSTALTHCTPALKKCYCYCHVTCLSLKLQSNILYGLQLGFFVVKIWI